jgi:glutamate formiminotransferase / 5-formyltetrahydrofolate cyclo-ligase
VNVSEGHPGSVLDLVTEAAGATLLDLHADAGHNRSVLTMAGDDLEEAVRAAAAAAVTHIDIREHQGAHPRIGSVDVVPFVPLDGSTFEDALAARNRFATWAADELKVPCFLYGPERTLPDLRRGAGRTTPDTGPLHPHPSAGAIAVGVRPLLVAYNLWLAEPDLRAAEAVVKSIRSTAVRALALTVGDHVQVSMNLVDPLQVGPETVYDQVAAEVGVARAELVGLLPAAALATIPPERWETLDLSQDRTIEARLAARSRPPGRQF